MAAESKFQSTLIREIQRMYPGAVILKNDPNYLQGIPDWLILHEKKWATFEVKASRTSPRQPNQAYYVRMLDRMSFSAFVYPEIKEDFLRELQQSLGPSRPTRISFSK